MEYLTVKEAGEKWGVSARWVTYYCVEGAFPMKKILIVEDDIEINGLITKYLQKEGYDTCSVFNGKDALAGFAKQTFHLVILDLMLPKVDGQEVLRQIRKSGTVPVIILSSKDREMDKIMGLELGADDYITKPFTVGELTARVKAQLRRFMNFSGTMLAEDVKILHHGDLVLNTGTATVTVAREPKMLTAKEFAILQLFLENPTRVFTKTHIFEIVWHEESLSDDNTVMVHINRLRSKIEADPQNPVYIKTVWGFGYKLGE
jgi:DNA-binding response OmpR family regulator